MKKIIFILFLLPSISHAQQSEKVPDKSKENSAKRQAAPSEPSLPNNVIKTNLFSLAVQNYNLTYERKIGRKLSLSVAFRYMPTITPPFKNQIQQIVNDPDFNVNDLRIGNTAFTGELRWYTGKRALKGFYIAPYFRYANFGFSLPVENPNNNNGGTTTYSPISFNGNITSLSAGLMIGVQYNLSKRLVLDFWILGGHYGKSRGILTATNINPPMTQADQDELQASLNDLNNSGPFTVEGKVLSPTSAEIKSTGPWAGIRSLSLSLGYKF
jgi:hypothetical protein